MALNFKIFSFETSESLHLKLDGDFDGNSAHELLNTLKKYGDGFYQIFIDTNDLKTIHPFGKEVFQKNLGAFKNQSHDIIFIGRNENELKAYQKRDLRNGLPMIERRLYERHIVILPTKLETILTAGEKKVFDVETRNISIGGAFIYSKGLSFFQEGRRVIIDFTIPSGSFFKYLADMKSIMECTGSMVRSTSEGVAIQFDRECEIIERRQFSYSQYIPERRSNKDRRSGLDRRFKPKTSK